MAFIGIKVPTEITKTLLKIEVPGERVHGEEMHITLIHLGNNVPIPEVLQTIMACYMITKQQAPFVCATKRVTCFPKNPESGVPVIASVICPELHKLHDSLKRSLNLLEIDYSNKYPEYKPHVTLSYNNEELDSDVKFGPVFWEVKDLVIWGGDHGVERIAVTLPLEGRTETSKSKQTKNAVV